MYKRDRLIHPVTGTLFAIVFMLFLARELGGPQAGDLVTLPEPNELRNQEIQAQPDRTNTQEKDLFVQQSMANAAWATTYAAWGTTIISVFAFCGLVLTIHFARRAWIAADRGAKSAHEMNKITLSASNHQLRAYLSARFIQEKSNIDIDLSQNQPTKAGVQFHIEVKNYGSTPATNVKTKFNVQMCSWPKAKADLPNLEDQPVIQGPIVNPGESWPLNIAGKIDFHDKWLYQNPPQTMMVYGVLSFENMGKSRQISFCFGVVNMKKWCLQRRHDPQANIELKLASEGNSAN